jgi:hypothetical protein
MTRITAGFAALVALTLVPAHVGADVKTRQKDSMKFEGMMGRVMSMAGVGGDPATSTVSVKGTRMASIGTARDRSSTSPRSACTGST